MRRWALALLVLSSCGKEPEKPAASNPSDPAPLEVADPATPPPAEPPPRPSGPRPPMPEPPVTPRLSLTANGSDVPEVPTGTPILLELWLTAPPEQSFTLHAAAGRWSSFVQLETPWAFRPALQVGPIVKLDATNSAVLVWTLPAKVVDALPRGEHAIGIKLDARQGAAPDSWTGLVQPPPIRVKLTDGPASPSKTQLLVRCALWERQNDEALKLVEKELAEQPDSPPLLALKAEALEAAGRPQEALQALDRAVASAKPPDLYVGLRAALRRRLAK